MAQNVIVAEDGSLIPTGDTQVEQVGEAASGADGADDRTDLIVGGADPEDTFALPDDQVFDSGEVVESEDSDAGVATPTDSGDVVGDGLEDGGPTITDTDGSTSDGGVDATTVTGGSGGGLLTAGGVGIAALLVGVVALVAGGGDG